MTDKLKVAVAGATGLVGSTMISILEQRGFPLAALHPLASERSEGTRVSCQGREYRVERLEDFDFGGVDIALFSAGAGVAREHGARAAAAGCVVIDNSSAFRYDDDIPLVVPEVNPGALAGYRARNIVANPNCSTIQLTVALAPIHREAGIERVTVATYQAVSGAGRGLVEELAAHSARLLNGLPVERGLTAKQIAFNVLPEIDVFEEGGYTREEMKIVWETRKILEEPELRVSATAVRVPVFYGHSEAVLVETRKPITSEAVRTLLNSAPGIEVLDRREPGGYPTAVTEAAHHDAVFVGRIREDLSHPRGLALWVVADNIRKGAALNTVQIAELLVKNYM